MYDYRYDIDSIKERLIAFREREEEISVQLLRFERIEMKLESIGSPQITDMPKAPSSSLDKFSDLVAQKIEIEQSIRENKEIQKKERLYFETVLKSMKKTKEKSVIRMRYFDVESWNDINYLLFGGNSDFLDKEESYLRRVHMLHCNALLNIAKCLKETSFPATPSDV